MNRNRRPAFRAQFDVESLEGKALLSIAQPGLEDVPLPPAEEVSVLTQTRPEPLSAPQQARASRIEAFRERLDTLRLRASRPVGVVSAATPVAARPITVNQVPGVVINRENANFDGGKTTYDLKVTANGYTFKQNYSIKIKRDRDAIQDGSFGALDAYELFLQRFSDQAAAVVGGGAAARGTVDANQNNGFQGVEITRENFRVRGGKTTYTLNINAGGYTFKQSYTMKINRDRGAVQDGSFGALDAFDLFATRFGEQALAVVSGGNNPRV